jgi:hypothetical protein
MKAERKGANQGEGIWEKDMDQLGSFKQVILTAMRTSNLSIILTVSMYQNMKFGLVQCTKTESIKRLIVPE